MHRVEKSGAESSLNISQISHVQYNDDEDQVLQIEDLVDLSVSELIDSFQAIRFQRQRLEEMRKAGVTSSSINLLSTSYVAPQNETSDNNATPSDPPPQNPTAETPKPNPRTPEWSDPLARQLQSLLIYKLHTIFNAAIQRLVDCGYEESAAKRAVSGAGLYRGGNNIVENIVNEALNVLENGACTDAAMFGSLGEMIEYTMVELVLVLVQMKPSLTISEAMWWFLVFDMDIAQACGVKGDLLAELRGAGYTVAGDPTNPTAAPRRIVDKANQLMSLAAKAKENSSRQLKNSKELDLLKRVFSEIAMKSPAQSQKKVSKSKATAPSSSSAPNRADYCDEIPFDESAGIYDPRDSRDEKILNLVEWVEKLKNEAQSWSDWANQKVMEAATKLKKDQAELAFLREEKELFDKYQKEKKMIEENMERSRSELQCSVEELRGEVEQSNGTIEKLKEEQAELRKEMEAAKLQALDSSAKCEKALEKERKAIKDVESWKKKSRLLPDEMKAYKQKIDELQQEMSTAEEARKQIQGKLEEEKTQKAKLLKQVASLKRFEAAMIKEEEAAKEKAKMDMKRYEEMIKLLDEELSRLKLKSESSRMAELKRNIYGGKGPENGVKPKRECVMCLSEEPSVVFVPCGHQVLCRGCNEIYKKRGIKDCPSCRTPIGKRISVRFSHL